MILEQFVTINVHSKNIKKLKDNGYVVKINDNVTVPIIFLDKNSHVDVRVRCDICNNEKTIQYRYYNESISKYNLYTCSSKCAMFKNKKTNFEKYGVEYIIQSDVIKNKVKNTLIDKYGVDSIFKSVEIKNKVKNTLINKYGVDNISKTIENKEKIKNTNIKKYNNSVFFKSEYFLKNTHYYRSSDEFKNIMINKYLKRKNISIDNILKINDQIIYTIKCDNNKEHLFKIESDMLRHRINYNTVICTICNEKYSFSRSGVEQQVYNFIKENYDNNLISNYRLDDKEIDIFLPELKIGFEINGLWWHNEIHKKPTYHTIKKEFFKSNDIDVFFIYEDDWSLRQDIVKSMILNKINLTKNKIFARKCEIKQLNIKDVKIFLNNNHIQGYTYSNINLGLYHNDHLVSLMSFNKKRLGMGKLKNDFNNDYELVRFCNVLNTNVIGGASKLFKYFIKHYNFDNIITFANLDYSNGNLYYKLDFTFDKKLNPNYYYVVNGVKKHRFGFRKDILVKQGYDRDKSEHEIMLERKIYRIYNSGNLKFIYK